MVRHHVVSEAGGRVGVRGSSRRQWGRRCSGGLLGMLQLLAVYLPLFGSSVLKPDLHLRYQRHKLFSVWFNWKILGHCLKYNDAKSLPCSLSLDSVCNVSPPADKSLRFIYFCLSLVIPFVPRETLLHPTVDLIRMSRKENWTKTVKTSWRMRYSPLTLLVQEVLVATWRQGLQRFLLI